MSSDTLFSINRPASEYVLPVHCELLNSSSEKCPAVEIHVSSYLVPYWALETNIKQDMKFMATKYLVGLKKITQYFITQFLKSISCFIVSLLAYPELTTGHDSTISSI